ncbi:unnamed protein product [Vicia faba]|uniref:Ribosomal protein L34e superfamily protein n=1 Tax=Vicia faba TaxID=3906 RepID=A0AAV0Z0B3_VICFA|nr:unnamed protein product [Vicia faba]
MQEGVVLTTAMPSSSSSSSSASFSSSSWSHHCNNLCNCKHAPSATLDLLILLLVLFSGAFLLSSYFSYIFNSLSLLLPSVSLPIPYLLAFVIFFIASVVTVELCCGARSRKCERIGCRGLKKATEFDLQIERFGSGTGSGSGSGLGLGEYDKLPWKGGSEGNPDYECLRSELRKMAPINGRALLLFRAPCGCPIAKLEAAGPKKGKRHKRFQSSATLNGGGNHR